jgi:ribosome-associated protein
LNDGKNKEHHPLDDKEEEHYISKSQLKREVEALQSLGVSLTELSADTLKKFAMDEVLLDALLFAQTIKSNGAKRRQMQYIGKLMRKVDAEKIQREYEQFQHARSELNAKFHQLEIWRDHLLSEGDTAINALLEEQPQFERTRLRQMVRNAAKEKATNKPPKSARQLFQYLKDTIS